MYEVLSIGDDVSYKVQIEHGRGDVDSILILQDIGIVPSSTWTPESIVRQADRLLDQAGEDAQSTKYKIQERTTDSMLHVVAGMLAGIYIVEECMATYW